MTTVRLEGHIVPKARPNFDGRSGRAYHAKGYSDWLEDAGWQVKAQRRGRTHEGPVTIKIVLAGEKAAIRVEDAEPTRPKGVQGDIDNIAGSVLDALEAGGIITNDKQATRLEVWFWDDDLEHLHSATTNPQEDLT